MPVSLADRMHPANVGARAMSDIVQRLRIKADILAMGEPIAFGSDTALMVEAAGEIEALRSSLNRTLANLAKLQDVIVRAQRRGRDVELPS